MGVRGAKANKMEASQEACFLGKNNPSLPPDYQMVCTLKESFHAVTFEFLKAYVDKLERNYIGMGDSPKKPA